MWHAAGAVEEKPVSAESLKEAHGPSEKETTLKKCMCDMFITVLMG